jgi:hypothetical protein
MVFCLAAREPVVLPEAVLPAGQLERRPEVVRRVRARSRSTTTGLGAAARVWSQAAGRSVAVMRAGGSGPAGRRADRPEGLLQAPDSKAAWAHEDQRAAGSMAAGSREAPTGVRFWRGYPAVVPPAAEQMAAVPRLVAGTEACLSRDAGRDRAWRLPDVAASARSTAPRRHLARRPPVSDPFSQQSSGS